MIKIRNNLLVLILGMFCSMSFANGGGGVAPDSVFESLTETGEGSAIYDDSVNTGVGSFNGELSNSFNNLEGDSAITIDKTDTTIHQGGYTDTQIVHSTNKTESIIKSTPNVNLTNLTTSGVDTCFGSATGGISLAGVGISGGSTITDRNCLRLKNAKLLSTLGLTDAAVALLALDPSVALAITIAYPNLAKRLVRNEGVNEISEEIETSLAAEKLSVHEEREALLKELAELDGTEYVPTELLSPTEACKGSFFTSYCEQKVAKENSKK